MANGKKKKKTHYAKNQSIKITNPKPVKLETEKSEVKNNTKNTGLCSYTGRFESASFGGYNTSLKSAAYLLECCFPDLKIDYGIIESVLSGLERKLIYNDEKLENSPEAIFLKEYTKTQLSGSNIDKVIKHILSSIKYGYAIFKLHWGTGIYDGHELNILKYIEPMDPDLFTFDNAGKLVYTGSSTVNVVYVDEVTNFKVVTYGSDNYGRRTGEGIYAFLSVAYSGYENLRDWELTALQRLAIPPIIATNKGKEKMNTDTAGEVRDFLDKPLSGNNLLLKEPNGDIELKTLNAYDKVGENFEPHRKSLKDDIAYLLLGSNDHVEDTGGGSYARSRVNADLRDAKLRDYVKMIETFINDEIIKTVVHVNYPGFPAKDMPKMRLIVTAKKEVTTTQEIEVQQKEDGTTEEKVIKKIVVTKEYI